VAYGSYAYGSVEYGGQLVPIVPIAPPAGKRFTLFIAGVDRTSLMLANTLQILNQMSQASTAKLTLLDSTGAFHPAVGQDVQIYSKALKVFGGTIDESTESCHQASKDVQAYLTCTDYSGVLDRRSIGAWYPGQVSTGLTTIVSAIVNTYLAADGFTYNAQDGDPGISLGDQLFQWVTVRQAFNQLATASNWEFNVDYNKKIRFFPSTSGLSAAPFNIADNDGNVLAVASKGSVTGATGESATVRTYRGPYLNRVYVTSSSQASPLWSDTFSAAIPGPYPNSKQPPGGGRRFFVTLYPINQTPIVTVNGASQRVIPLSAVATAVPSSWDWYWIPPQGLPIGGFGVSQNPNNTALVSTDVLIVNYATELSPATTAVCTAQVAARAQVEGNTGYYDAVISAPDLTDPTALANFANYILNRYGCTNGIPQQVIYSTIKDGLFAGMLQTINLSQPLIASHSYLISQIQAYDVDKDHLEYQVTCDFGAYLATTSDQFFASLINAVQGPQPSNFNTYVWQLSGTYPWTRFVQNVRNPVENLQYMTVVFLGLASPTDMTVQLIVNGSGVGAPVTPTTVNQQVTQFVFGGTVGLQYTVHLGDQLTFLIQGAPSASDHDGVITLVTSVAVT
jgi:hypothetical protein